MFLFAQDLTPPAEAATNVNAFLLWAVSILGVVVIAIWGWSVKKDAARHVEHRDDLIRYSKKLGDVWTKLTDSTMADQKHMLDLTAVLAGVQASLDRAETDRRAFENALRELREEVRAMKGTA